MTEVARYRCLEKAHCNVVGSLQPRIVEAGEIAEVVGVPSLGMAPQNDAARAAYAAMLRNFRAGCGAPWGQRIDRRTAVKIASALGRNLDSNSARIFIAKWLAEQENAT